MCGLSFVYVENLAVRQSGSSLSSDDTPNHSIIPEWDRNMISTYFNPYLVGGLEHDFYFP